MDPGALKGDAIAFIVTREFSGNKSVNKYAGELAGGSLTG